MIIFFSKLIFSFYSEQKYYTNIYHKFIERENQSKSSEYHYKYNDPSPQISTTFDHPSSRTCTHLMWKACNPWRWRCKPSSRAFFFDKPVLEREETTWLWPRIAHFVEQIIFVLLKRPSRSPNVQRIGNTRRREMRGDIFHAGMYRECISLVTVSFQRQWKNAAITIFGC